MNDLGKALVGIGLLLAVLGAVLILAARLGLPLGRLPGDIAWRGKNVSIFFPLGTSILASIVLSAILFPDLSVPPLTSGHDHRRESGVSRS